MGSSGSLFFTLIPLHHLQCPRLSTQRCTRRCCFIWLGVLGRRHRFCHAGSRDRARSCGGLEHGRIRGLAVWAAVSRRGQRDCGRCGGIQLAAFTARRLAKRNLCSLADLHLFIEHGTRAMAERMARGPGPHPSAGNPALWQNTTALSPMARSAHWWSGHG